MSSSLLSWPIKILACIFLASYVALFPSLSLSAPIYCYIDNKGKKLFTDQELEDKNYRLLWVKGLKKPNLSKGKKKHKRFDEIIRYAARSNRLDPALVKAVIHAESYFNPEAVSKKGAQGLMQLMPATANYLAVRNPFDAKQNIMGGSKYLNEMLARFNGNSDWALAAYNAGPTAVDKYGGIPPYKETIHYVQKVNKLWEQYKTERLWY